MFENPPTCWLHHQGNFITSFFPKGLTPGVDYDVFYFPPVDAQYGKPFLVAGDIMAAFQDRPEVRAVMQLFSTGAGVKGWLEAGGASRSAEGRPARLVRRSHRKEDRRHRRRCQRRPL